MSNKQRRALVLTTLLTVLCVSTANSIAQTTRGKDLISRASSNNDVVNCQFQANEIALTATVADDYVVQPFIHNLNVFSLSGLGLISAADADGILDDVFDLLNTDSGNNDISCRILMRRSGAISFISSPAGTVGGVITTEAALQALRDSTSDSRGDVIVVAGLTACGGAGSFNGCAFTGRSMIINISSARDSTWAHEFGHVQDRQHRPTTGSNCLFGSGNQNIMYPTGCSGRKKVNAAECAAYFTKAAC